MTWTTEYPTKPGFYWIRNYRIVDCTGEYGSELSLAEVEYDELSEFEFYLIGSEFLYRKANILKAEWQGPIEPDAEPYAGFQEVVLKPTLYRSTEIACRDCDGTDGQFLSWKLSQVDSKPVYGIICRECWIKRLTPEQRKVYMV